MFTRVVAVLVMLWTLSLSALGVAFGADKEKSGFLGVVPGEVTSDIASEYGVRAGEGVVVEGVSPDSPAREAGLRENDIIISVNSTGVTGPEEFRDMISGMKAGDKVNLTYMRGGKQKAASVELASREGREFGFWGPGMMKGPKPPRAPGAMREERGSRPPRDPGVPREPHDIEHGEKVAFAGLVAQDLSEGLRSYFKVEEGALISEVVEGSPADKAGLKAGDVIIRIGEEEVESEGDVRAAIQNHKPGDRIDFVVMRDRQQQTFTVTLGEQETPDLGDLDITLPDLESLKDMHIMVPNEDEMRALEEKLKDMHLKLDSMEPLDIHIEQLPDNGRIHIEKYMIGPVRNDGHSWRRSWETVKEQFRSEFAGLTRDFARLRDELIALGNELMGRTA